MRPSTIFLIALFFLLVNACSKPAHEDPFNYPFIKRLHLKRQPGAAYAGYKAFYLVTEDFEPLVESSSQIDSIKEVLKFASLPGAGCATAVWDQAATISARTLQ